MIDPEYVAHLPERVVVGANGAYWRHFGDGYSMCPVSEDNDPVEVVAVYVREGARPTREHPGEDHLWSELTCLDCGRPGMVNLSIVARYSEGVTG